MHSKLLSFKKEEDDGWTYTHYVLDVDALDRSIFEGLAEFMRTDFLQRVFDDFFEVPTDNIFITFSLRIGDKLLVSETVLWQMMIDAFDDCEQRIILYHQALEHHFSQKLDLPWTSTTEQLGAYALQNYFDRAILNESFRSIDLELIDAYFTYVKLCDLDHEVHQHGYMIKIIEMLMYRDPQRMAEWLCFRYFNGQVSGINPETPSLPFYAGGVVKMIVDTMIKETFLKEYFLDFCTMIYGSDSLRVDEVMAYVIAEFGRLNQPLPESSRSIHRSTKEGDDFILKVSEHWPRFEIDTGFHKFDRNQRAWVKVQF